MAEAVATAAGIAGFISLAIQLGQGAVKLKQLYGKLRSAPALLDQAILGIATLQIQM